MSLLPLIFRDMMSMSTRPLRMLENHMRMTEELLQPFMTPMHHRMQRYPAIELQEDPDNVIHDKDKFQVRIDVQNFAPNEITVKTVDGNAIQIEGKHEKKDDASFVSKHFVRKFVIPHGHELKDIVSSLSSDGILTITAPKKVDSSVQERVIEITHTGPEREAEDKQKNAAEAS